MPLNITIDHATTANGSEHSSITDEEDSSGTGVQVSPSSTSGSQEYPDPLEEEEGWGVVYADDIGPSDSASRPRTSNQHRPVVEAPNPEVARRQTSRRQSSHGRIPLRPRVHQQRPRASPESVDSNEDWPGYARGPPPPHGRAYWPPMAGAVAGALPPSHAPSYSGHGYHPYTNTSIIPAGQQLVPFANQPYGYSPYQPAPAPNAPTYFGQGGAPGYGHPGAPPMANPITTHGGSPFSGQEMTHHGASPGYFPFPPQAYSMPQPIPPIYHHYTPVYSPPPQVNTPPPPSDSGKDDEKFARIEKLFLDQKAELEAKEAAARKAADDKAARDEAEKEVAGMVAAAAAEAAAAAKDEAEKKAAEEAAAKEKALADEKTAAEAAAAASAAAAAAAAPPPPPEEKKKPIKFKDAVGRKFSFPFHLCNTWEGMEDLIKQAFLHVEIIGPHVHEGHYDLVGPNGDIILPQVWQTVVEPDWTITMHMWPMPEPKPDEPPAEGDKAGEADAPPAPPPPPNGGVVIVPDRRRQQRPPPFLAWTAGRNKGKKKAAKPAAKKEAQA